MDNYDSSIFAGGGLALNGLNIEKFDWDARSSGFSTRDFYRSLAFDFLSAFDPFDPFSAFYTDFFDFVSPLSYFDFLDLASFGGLSPFSFDLLFDFSLIYWFKYKLTNSFYKKATY